MAVADELLERDVQLCFLGAGEAKYESWLRELAARLPNKVAARIGFDEGLAHRIEAGADMFLMPSRFEPCGLNQMYSLAYGTVPIVRATGGLADSVIDAAPDNVANGTATGFSFTDYSPAALSATIGRALALYSDRAEWLRLVRSGMNQDFSWRKSALQYIRVYERALAKRRAALAAAGLAESAGVLST
jgi:starch synthase